MDKTHRIGFVGLGSMGLPMACNLLAAGYEVHGADRQQAAIAALVQAGGQGHPEGASAATKADLLILMVVNAAQARAVLLDEGALLALPPGGLVCLMATCPPDEVRRLAAEVTAAGRRFLDCPVSGGVAGAKAASLTLMGAGAKAIWEEAAPVLRCLGTRLYYCGAEAGQGAAVKAINQLLCGVHLAAAAEAIALGEKAGVDTAVLLDLVTGSSAGSWMLADRGPRMLQAEPPVTSAVDIFVKDLGIALAAGEAAGMGLPLAAAARQMFLAESGAGGGRSDDSQVIAAYRRLAGLA